MPVFLFLLMLGLGATLSADNFHQILRQPKPLLIGLASQYGWMPLIALTLVLALNLPPAISVGLIIVSCTSGGPLSNFFTYISRADLALSIAMTVASTVCGLVMIPLLLLIYTAPLVDTGGGSNLAIPYGKIIATLIVILVPVGFGIFLRSRNPLWAARVERGGSVAVR
ncbi:MAG: bile acid:sodium symporter [Gammaproteobacteria bacterium]|nr:bile acid:sodium symporter [Gammaproteobacteria bacterium]